MLQLQVRRITVLLDYLSMEIVAKPVSIIIRLWWRKILDEKYISDNDKIQLMEKLWQSSGGKLFQYSRAFDMMWR